jgi:nitronate monooxygenase
VTDNRRRAAAAPRPTLRAEDLVGGWRLVSWEIVYDGEARVTRPFGRSPSGLILVCTGAGGHTGSVSPFVFVDAVRQFFDGIVVLAGGICNGGAIRAAEVAGADLADIGTLFIAARESLASDDYRQMVVEAGVEDLVLTRAFTGASAYYLRRSVERYGLDPDNLSGKTAMDWKDSEQQLKAWKDIWSAGQSVSAVSRVEGAAEIIDRLRREYERARKHP